MRRSSICVVLLILTTGCGRDDERAGRYPPRHIFADKPLGKVISSDPVKPPSYWAWREPKQTFDIPIVFVASSSPQWEKLKAFWTVTPTAAVVPALMSAIAPLGPVPVNVAAALQLAGPWQIKIKVPRGLPDPNPLIPSANPPTYAKWKLGKELFFEKMLYADENLTPYSCASCHDPKKHFSDGLRKSLLRGEEGDVRTPSLINVLYNRHQFWDGRVKTLEEVVTRELDDETLPLTKQRFGRHIFGGLPKYLEENPYFKGRFREVFGQLPTQDAIAKALATYLRTILSGNARVDEGSLPEATEKGRVLFVGKANCAVCHPAQDGLYTDHDFHNVGLPGYIPGVSPDGRLAQVPPGLKETRLTGAFRTPSLRNVTKSKAFMHNGVFSERVANVIYHFNEVQRNPYLAPELKTASGNVRTLGLTNDEVDSLVAFLQALEGEAVDARVSDPPQKLP
jgi:cytochrome c peroxidase